MEITLANMAILVALCMMAMLYSSVGHGGASGYLAILSLTAFASNDSAWLKQHAWSLNLLVAGLAFYAYRKRGFFDLNLALPFVIASVPAAIIGGYLRVDGEIYDSLLSITLLFAAWKLYSIKQNNTELSISNTPPLYLSLSIGAVIGLFSGIVGVGGGIFLSPLILILGWGDVKTTAGVAALFVWVNSAAGLIGSGLSGQLVIEFDTLIPFGLSVFIGGYIGSKYGVDVFSQDTVKKLLIVVLLIAATKRLIEIVS